MLRLEAAPDDRGLRRELDAWLADDDAHRQAWRRVRGAWDLIGEAPADPEAWPGETAPATRHRRPGPGLWPAWPWPPACCWRCCPAPGVIGRRTTAPRWATPWP
ncbi:DUF4880 domain-containing protein [Alcanivorax sp. IO_7]|nr:DUF4880 domain-containing protein [Alcanivorax sp. IO_7]